MFRSVLPKLGEEGSNFLLCAVLGHEGEILAVLEETFQAHWRIRECRTEWEAAAS